MVLFDSIVCCVIQAKNFYSNPVSALHFDTFLFILTVIIIGIKFKVGGWRRWEGREGGSGGCWWGVKVKN